MTPAKSAAIGAAIGVLTGMSILAALPAFYLPGQIEVRYEKVEFKPMGKNRGIGTFKTVDKAVALKGECRISASRVICLVNMKGPQI